MLLPLANTIDKLAAGALCSSELVESCLASIADPSGEGALTFTRIFADAARSDAQQHDARLIAAPLAGLPISVKDLFDIKGLPTTAGSVVLADGTHAANDAAAIIRLRNAGAIILGRTNMTEFAFSGLGLNPHYGTPANPYDRANRRIPGGSSSGAAISVTDGMAYAAIGSDTGGSIRIPAALCGLTGFKPTARRVPLDGVLPLSPTLDSIGVIAPTVSCCARIDAVLSGQNVAPLRTVNLAGLRLGVLQGYVLNGLDADVSAAFSSALTTLSSLGAHVEDVAFSSLDKIPEANQKGGFPAAESYAWHRPLIEKNAARYDPRVASRILRGKEVTAADYIDLLHVRQSICADAANTFSAYDAILMPTVPRIAPRIADLQPDDATYFEANIAFLRNPAVINFLDGCALSIPCHIAGNAPAGLMIAGLTMQDEKILSIGTAIEFALAATGRAIHGDYSVA